MKPAVSIARSAPTGNTAEVRYTPDMAADEQTLIAEAREGSTGAFEALVAPLIPKLFGLARHLTGDHHDAEEILQNALVKAWQAMPRFRGQSSFSTWVYRIVHNAFKDELRARSRRGLGRHTSLDSSDNPPPLAAAGESAVRYAVLHDGMARLAPEPRMLLYHFYFDGMSIEELAALGGMRAGAVKTRLHRARKDLAKILGGNLPDGAAV